MGTGPEELVASLPEGRAAATRYRIAVVCLGNICRSPIAEVVLREKLDHARLGDEVEVVSAGTGDWHIGDAMDPRAAAVLVTHGYDPPHHRARRFESAWFDECDLVLAMDDAILAEIAALRDTARVTMFRDFDPRAAGSDRNVPDPYFGGDQGFDSVLDMVERTASAIVAQLSRRRDED